MSTDAASTLAPIPESPMAAAPSGGGNELAFMSDKAAFDHLWRVASSYARSMITPENFRGKPDDCFIICQLAIRLKVDPFMLMQGMYIVHGRPGMEAKLAIALANQRGGFRDRIRFRMEGEGKSRKCTAFAHDRSTGDLLESEVSWTMVEAEGWNKDKESRSGYVQKSKWNTMPDQMFRYRSAMFLIRTFCPEVLMGVPSVDELDDMVVDTTFQPLPPQLTNSRPQDACVAPTKSEVLADILAQKKEEPAGNQTTSDPAEVNQKTEPITVPAETQLPPDEIEAQVANAVAMIKEATKKKDVDELVNHIPRHFRGDQITRITSAAEMWYAEHRPVRGEKSNGAMFDKSQSATESGQ